MKKIKLITCAVTISTMVLPLIALAAEAAAVAPGQGFIDILNNITMLAMNVLIGVGVLFLVLSGFMFILARGDESKLSTARSMLLWSVIGIAVGALAPVFLNLATSVIGNWWAPAPAAK
jgi:hypothetical protein